MRQTRTLAAAAALVALTALAGCGGDPADELGLPAAGDIASIQKLINQHAVCDNLRPDDEGKDRWEAFAQDPAWAIKERALCDDASNRRITLLSISDMSKFQAANRKASEGGKNHDVLLGKDFALVPEGNRTTEALLKAKLLVLTCSGAYEIPSGFKQHKGMADGCLLTDYSRS
ncbi:hypothetical protein [Streptomyces sp. NPDC058874]|uniref:hypothetical protein n=1 Tax=unclassified Streptomyces TaxID=2593676 RepID=UPI0036738979